MNGRCSPLLTDLYQLTMLESYLEYGMEDVAVFEFFVRKLPPGRNFLLAAGLDQALFFLENLQFSESELEWLSSRLKPATLDYLKRMRFSGDVHAMHEGTVFFPEQPILRVTAPLPQAQLVETRLINLLHFETMVASKAARSVLAAPGKLLVDFGLRRAHGAEAGLLAARASYLAGFAGTATVLAGEQYGIPVFGTMAHSYIQAHSDEMEAFEHFARSHSDNVILLIDTYDTEIAASKVVVLADRLREQGIAIKGVRLDSGDLAAHSKAVRKILDDGGLQQTTIFASGNLDEYRLHSLLSAGAPIDGFGVGTALVTSGDAPSLDCAYKLQEYAGRPRRKRSEGKATWPGRKQVYRHYDTDGVMCGDVVALANEDTQLGAPLLHHVMRDGKRIAPNVPLSAVRDGVLAGYAELPQNLCGISQAPAYPVEISGALRELARQVDGKSAA